MQRPCDVCGRRYEAKRPGSMYCSDTCRKRATRRRAASQAVSAPPVVDLPSLPVAVTPLVAAVEQELTAAGRLDTAAGQRALLLAQLLATPGVDTGSAKAALDRQLAAAMAQAMDGVAAAVDALDELRARRERRRA